jgi:hypothetical protein
VSADRAAAASALRAALERGADFVRSEGGEPDRRLAAVLLGRTDAASLADCASAELARADAISPEGAWRWLARLADARALHAAPVETLCRALESTQREDGSWSGGDAALEARLELTGCLAGQLARTPFARPERLERAADFLAAHFAPERVKGGAWRTLAAYAQTFANLPHDASDGILQWCGRELERAYRSGAVDAVRAARVLRWCDAASLPGGALAQRELGAPLLALQQADGGWLDPSEPDADARVRLTLDALAALAALPY